MNVSIKYQIFFFFSVCSTTLWVGHLSKLVQQEELSDTFAKYGDIISIDMIVPRGCAFLVMNRRQDAYKAMNSLKNFKLQGRPIIISWAAGKGVKGKEWKDYWDLDTGTSYIPFNKLSNATDFESLEEGGMFDEDSMPTWLKEKLKSSNQKKDLMPMDPNQMFGQINMTGRVDTTQPPPGQMMSGMSMVPPFMGPVPRLMTPMGLLAPNLVPGLSIGVPPPPMTMIQAGAMVPGLPPIPMDKSVPPPSGNQPAFMNHFPPMPPHQMSHLPPVSIPSNSDDHMDIEMEDEPSTKIVSSGTNMNMFNRPPPQFDQSMPPMPIPTNMPQNYSKDHNERDRRQGHDRRSNSRDRRSNEREFRTGERGRDRDRSDRDRRNDFRNNGSNSRWPDERSRSRDNDNSFRDNRRGSRDRNERDKSLQDRLRDMANANDAKRKNEYNRRNESSDCMPPWRDGPQMSGNYQGNFMDQSVRNVRPMNMSGPTPLEDIRISPMVMDNIRGPPPGMAGHRGGE